MKPRTLLHLLSTAALAALPLESHADASAKALEACSQAFIQHLSSTHGAARYRVDKPASRVQANSRIGHRTRNIDLTLFATVTSSGEMIASANCTTTASGELLAMTPVPVTAPKGLLLSARGAK